MATEREAIHTEPQPATPRKFSSPGANAGRPALRPSVSRLDGDLAGGSCASSFLEDSPQLCVQCKVASLLEITPQSGPRLCGTNLSCACGTSAEMLARGLAP